MDSIIKDDDIFTYLNRATSGTKRAFAIHLREYFSRMTVSSEEPQNPSEGDIWIDIS